MGGVLQVDSIEVMGSAWLACAAVCWLLLAAAVLGRWLQVILRVTIPSSVGVWIQVVVGLDLLAFLGLVLSPTGQLSHGRSLMLLGLVVALGVPLVGKRASQLAERVKASQQLPGEWLTWLIVGPFLLLTLGPALCYPVGWDELVYHSVLPRRWHDDGSLLFYRDLPYSGFPSLVEILCWLVTPLESLVVSRLLIWVCWAIALLLMSVAVRQHCSGFPATSIVMAVAASNSSLMVSANCYVEVFIFMNLSALFLLLAYTHTSHVLKNSVGSAILLGILVGGCMAVKPTGTICICVPLLWCLANCRRGHSNLRCMLMSVTVMVIAAMLFAGPFYVRPWINTGNPFYPYFANWFSIAPNAIETSLYHHDIGSAAFGLRGLAAFLMTPVLLAWDSPLYDGSYGWQFLLLLGLTGFACLQAMRSLPVSIKSGDRKGLLRQQSSLAHCQLPTDNATTWIALSALALYVFWFFTAQQARFILPVTIAVCTLAGKAMSMINQRARTVASMLLYIATVASFPWTNSGYYLASWERLLGIWTATEFVNDSTEGTYVPLVKAIQEFVPEKSRLMLLNEHRSLYIPRRCVIATPFFQEAGFTPPEDFADPDRIIELMQANEIKFVVLTTEPIGPDRSSGWWHRLQPLVLGIEALVAHGDLQVVWSSPRYLLLERRQD